MTSRKAAIVFFLVLLLPASDGRAVIIDKIAAIVNDDVITASEVAAIQHLGLNVSDLPGEQSVLEQRIDQHLVLQQLAKQPPVTLPAEDLRVLLRSVALQHNGFAEFLLFLNSIGMSYADFEKEARDQLTIRSFLRARFRPFVNISLEEAEKYYNDVYKPALEKSGKEARPFTESFEEIQNALAESQVQEKTKQYLSELRKSANIAIKE